MDLTVKHAGSDVQLQAVPGSESIGQLKARLEQATGLFVRQQKLIFKGKVLDNDSATLDACKLGPGAKLMLLASGGVSSSRAKPVVAPAAKRPATATAGAATAGAAARAGAAGLVPHAAAKRVAAAAPGSMSERRQSWAKTGVIALRDLQLESLEDNVLEGVPNAKAADLSINRLAALPQSLSCLQSLQSLRLADNRLTNEGLPWAALAQLTALTSLNLDRNALTSLPGHLSALGALARLSVAENELVEVEEAAAGGWASLQQLNLRANRLAALPESIGACSSLIDLDVCSNRLERLPDSLSQLQRLQTLRADSNRLQRLPGALLASCHSLATVGLHSNPITVQQLRAAPGFADYEARRVARCNKQLDGRVLTDTDGNAFSEGADVEQWQHWQHQAGKR